MPITINGTTDSRIGLLTPTLSGFSTDLDGTYTAPGNNVGSMNPIMSGFVIDLDGQYAPTASFNGDLDLTLDGFLTVFIGNQTQTVNGAVSASLSAFDVAFQSSQVAEADWQSRISGTGVVLYHDFRNAAEIDQFRWTSLYGGGNDPTGAGQLAADGTNTSMYRQTADGVTGGACMEMLRPAGTGENQTGWERFFSALPGTDNGRGIDDPGADGTVTLASYTPTDQGSEISNWESTARPGHYGHADYHTGTKFDGEDYWLQMRVKMDPRRNTGGNESIIVGKLFYLTTTGGSLTGQEFVTYSNGYFGANNYHRIYTAGSPTLEEQDSLGRPGQQVGGDQSVDYASGNYCDVTNGVGQASRCWSWSGGWDTILYHVIPGHESVEDTTIEAWAAHEGDTNYVRLWDVTLDMQFQDPARRGWNSIILSTYHNGINLPQDFWHRYDQIILSKKYIPCPQLITTPAWFESLAERTWTPIAGGAGYGSAFQNGASLQDVVPVPLPVPGGVGYRAKIVTWNGAATNQVLGEYTKIAEGGHNGYYGNEVNVLALRDEVPAWRRIWGPTPNASIDASNVSFNQPHVSYNDNTPRCMQGWFNRFVTNSGRMFTTATNGGGGGEWTTDCWSIDRADLSDSLYDASLWMYHGRLHTSIPGGVPGSSFGWQEGPGVYDPVTDTIWRGADFAAATPSNGIVSIHVPTCVAAGPQATSGPQVPGSTLYDITLAPNPFANAWSVITNTSPRCWIIGSPNDDRLYVWNLDDPTVLRSKITSGGSVSGTTGAGAVYSEANQKIVLGGVNIGTTLRTLSIPDDPWNETTGFNWGTIASAGGTITAGGAPGFGGTFSQFQMVENMGNGQSCIVMHVDNPDEGPTLVYKLPEAF